MRADICVREGIDTQLSSKLAALSQNHCCFGRELSAALATHTVPPVVQVIGVVACKNVKFRLVRLALSAGSPDSQYGKKSLTHSFRFENHVFSCGC